MSLPLSNTTSDALNWDEAMSLIRRLYRDHDYTLSLLIATGCFTGLRISDIFQHSSVKTTRIYLGLRKEELMDTYDQLEM